MTRDMGEVNIVVVAHPTMPIASAQTRGFYLDHRTMWRCGWYGYLTNFDGSLKGFEIYSAHNAPEYR